MEASYVGPSYGIMQGLFRAHQCQSQHRIAHTPCATGDITDAMRRRCLRERKAPGCRGARSADMLLITGARTLFHHSPALAAPDVMPKSKVCETPGASCILFMKPNA